MAGTLLVTGGTGFVAGWCIVELLRRGHDVRTTVRSAAKADVVRAAVSTQVDPGGRLGFAIADLNSEEGWDEAVAGCDYVLHVASPLGWDGATLDQLVEAARGGAVRVLSAAARAGVRRTVLTSSLAAAARPLQGPDSITDETVWTNLKDPALTPYRKSKVLSERAAWDFMMSDEAGAMELTTILPTAVFGPILTKEGLGSVQVIGRFLSGALPGLPKLGFNIVDVRDLAVAHVLAMTEPKAAGERIIATSNYLWFAEIAAALKAKLGDRAARVPTRRIPDFVLRLMALINPEVRALTPTLGRRHDASAAKAHRLLGWKGRPAEETVVDCAESLIAFGAVKAG